MNNLTFGNDAYQYYETICSGAPAGPGFNGADAVHTHMTNSRLDRPGNPRNTLSRGFGRLPYPPEFRRAWQMARRQWHTTHDPNPREAGIRRALRPSPRRAVRRKGGEPGQTGRNYVRRNDGTIEELIGAAHTVLDAGEAFTVVTPTGGGFGKPEA